MRGLAGLDHPLDEGDHAVDHAAKVDADQPVEIAVGRVLDRAETVDAGRVEQQRRRRAKHRLDLVGGTLIGGAIGDVEHDAVRRDALALQRCERPVDGFGPHIGDHDLRARPAEHLRLSESGTRGAPGDERDLVLEVLHHRLLARSCFPVAGRSLRRRSALASISSRTERAGRLGIRDVDARVSPAVPCFRARWWSPRRFPRERVARWRRPRRYSSTVAASPRAGRSGVATPGAVDLAHEHVTFGATCAAFGPAERWWGGNRPGRS